jgi:hypothetical protein
MKKRDVSDKDLKSLEDYLQDLLDRFCDVHGDPNVQIYFSGGQWGFIDDGDFTPIGTLKDLEKWLKSHCDECEAAWESDPES